MTKIVSVGEIEPGPTSPAEEPAPGEWSVKLSGSAARNLKKRLQPAEKEAVKDVLRRLHVDPFSVGLKPLNQDDRWIWKGEGEARAVRIVLAINRETREVHVHQVAHRGSLRYPDASKELLERIEHEMTVRGLRNRMEFELVGLTDANRCVAALGFVREHAGEWLVDSLTGEAADKQALIHE